MNKENIISAIYGAIDVTNEQLPLDRRINKSPDSPIMGGANGLDSIDLVSFIVALEDGLREVPGAGISLAQYYPVEGGENPFLTVESLSSFLGGVLSN